MAIAKKSPAALLARGTWALLKIGQRREVGRVFVDQADPLWVDILLSAPLASTGSRRVKATLVTAIPADRIEARYVIDCRTPDGKSLESRTSLDLHAVLARAVETPACRIRETLVFPFTDGHGAPIMVERTLYDRLPDGPMVVGRRV